LNSPLINGPYEAEVIPVVWRAIVGLPDTPLPLVIDTPPPAVMVLPEIPPLPLPTTTPVVPVKSDDAFNADTEAVNATPPILKVPVTFNVSELIWIGA
tara:strand:+ start:1692 stop:1985 length:294 start_codon:yes stop_codon:yes gene_type:complete